MNINKLLRGQSYTLPVYFKNSSGLPIVLASPPSFSFNDFDNAVLVTGLCVQDNVDSSKWTATFTVPTGVTLTTNDETAYTLTWTANLPNNTNKQVSKQFEVAEENFTVVDNNIPILTTADSIFGDFLQIPNPFTTTKYNISLRTDMGNVLVNFADVEDPDVFASSAKYNVYQFLANDTLGNIVDIQGIAGNIQAVWKYVVNGITYTKINPVYILNALGFSMVQNLRMTVDRYKFIDLDPNLQWKDYELLHFVITGVQRINASNPPTQFDITTLPASLTYAVGQAALVEACRAWFLAEGMRAFEFQGQDVSLNIDRTQYIQTVMDSANSWLDSNLRDTKMSAAILASSGSRALATVSYSPTSNFPGMASRYWPGMTRLV